MNINNEKSVRIINNKLLNMSNWFENNQTKSVITYTFFVAAATWAFYTFTFEEQKIGLYQAQVETSKTEIEQYKARIEFLEKEQNKLEIVLKEFEDWNYKSKDPALFYKNKYEEIVIQKKKYDSIFNKSDDTIFTQNPKLNNIEKKISLNQTVDKGKTYINDNEKLVIGVNDIFVSGKCNITISAGTKINEVYKGVSVGNSYQFGKLKITLSEIDYISSQVKFHITKE